MLYMSVHIDNVASVCRQVVSVAEPQKMMVLLQFIIDTDGLIDCCRDEWSKIYDKQVGCPSTLESDQI